MRIAFNAQRLAGQRFGVGRYIEYMLRHWFPALEADETLTVFLRKPLDVPIGPSNPRVDYVTLQSDMSGLPWETLKLSGAASKHDVLFCPAYSAPLGFRAPLVVATHSVNETDRQAHGWLYRQTYSRLYRHCARRADAVIVPGKRTCRAVIDYYGVAESRVTIVHQGADDAFQPIAHNAALRAARAQFFGPDRPYILFVGKGSERRNIPRLVEAFATLRKNGTIPHGLVLFGPYHGSPTITEIAAKLGVADDVIQTDGVVANHADLVPVYAGADAFVHPSENEGWSMTTTEALACGVPVIASNRGGLGEVAAGHAHMVEDPSVDALTEALARVLTDEALRVDLKQKARARGAALRWDVLARQTLDIVRATARNSREIRP
jgi:glycosyltransferase involved in cell wall biosynthesis